MTFSCLQISEGPAHSCAGEYDTGRINSESHTVVHCLCLCRSSFRKLHLRISFTTWLRDLPYFECQLASSLCFCSHLNAAQRASGIRDTPWALLRQCLVEVVVVGFEKGGYLSIQLVYISGVCTWYACNLATWKYVILKT